MVSFYSDVKATTNTQQKVKQKSVTNNLQNIIMMLLRKRETGASSYNGKKWKANAETTEGVNKVSLLVDAYLKSENRNSDILRKNLEQQFNRLSEMHNGRCVNRITNFIIF